MKSKYPAMIVNDGMVELAESIDDCAIVTDKWLDQVAPLNDELDTRVKRFIARRKAKRESAGELEWYSSEGKTQTCAEYLVKLFDRFERIHAISRGDNPARAQQWRVERIGDSVNNESDLSSNIMIYAICRKGCGECLYDRDTVYLVSRCEYHWEDEPEARDLDVEAGALDWTLGWYAVYLDGTHAASLSEKLSAGYFQNPTCEIREHCVSRKWDAITIRGEDHFRARETATGRTVKLYPDVRIMG